MEGAGAVRDHSSWIRNRFANIVAKNRFIEGKIDDALRRIATLRKEKYALFNLHNQFMGACKILEFLCNIFHSANRDLKEGSILKLKAEWNKLSATPESKDVAVSMLIERLQKISIEADEPCVRSTSEEAVCIYEKKKSLEEEVELGLKFPPSLAIFEDCLMIQNGNLRTERSQLEDKAKKLLSSFARIKLDLNKYENEYYRLRNVLLKNSNTLSSPKKIEIKKMLSKIEDIGKSNSAMHCEWQIYHNVLCGIIDDVRVFDAHAIKICEKIGNLCKCCKRLNNERLKLLYKVLERESQEQD